MESGEIETNERRVPETLEEACELRDASATSEERDYYQEHVYRLRGQEYRSHGIRTEESAWRRGGERAAVAADDEGAVALDVAVPHRGSQQAEVRGFQTPSDGT